MALKLPSLVIMVDHRRHRMPFRLTACRVKAYDAESGEAADLEVIADPDHAAMVAGLEPDEIRANGYAMAYLFDYTEEATHGKRREDQGAAADGQTGDPDPPAGGGGREDQGPVGKGGGRA